jgi:hypothetical protein
MSVGIAGGGRVAASPLSTAPPSLTSLVRFDAGRRSPLCIYRIRSRTSARTAAVREKDATTAPPSGTEKTRRAGRPWRSPRSPTPGGCSRSRSRRGRAKGGRPDLIVHGSCPGHADHQSTRLSAMVRACAGSYPLRCFSLLALLRSCPWWRSRRPTSAPPLVAEAFVTTLAVIALVWLAWVALWLIEQRW